MSFKKWRASAGKQQLRKPLSPISAVKLDQNSFVASASTNSYMEEYLDHVAAERSALISTATSTPRSRILRASPTKSVSSTPEAGGIMSLSVPYHPYKCCLFCGSNHSNMGKKKSMAVKSPTSMDQDDHVIEWWPMEGPLADKGQKYEKKEEKKPLHRCSGCRQALYCCHDCQRHDWNVS